MSRNDNYFLRDALLSSFTLKTYDNVDAIREAIGAGDVTATAELPAGEEFGGIINARTSLINGGAFAFLNTSSEVLKEVKIRQAIQMGVDMDKVREGIDDGEKLNYPILDSQVSGLTYPELPKYDVEAAHKLLADAKLTYNKEAKKLYDIDGGVVTLNIAVLKRDKILNRAERFAEELKNLGFEVSMNVFDESLAGADFITSVIKPREYDILFYEIDLGVSADPFVYYSSTQANESGWNFSNYRSSLADVNLLSARLTADAKLRKAKYEAFMKSWVSEVPAIGLYRSTLHYYYNRNADIYGEDTKLTDALDRFADVRYWASEKRIVNMTP